MSYSCSSYSGGCSYNCSASETITYKPASSEPSYTARFYSHDSHSDIKYGKFELDYSRIEEIKEMIQGPPLESYIPRSSGTDGAISAAAPKPIEMVEPKENIIDEIKKAQREILRVKMIKVRRIKRVRFKRITNFQKE